MKRPGLSPLPLILLLLAGIALPLAGEEKIPSRPEQLRFRERPFQVPKAEAYRHELRNGVPVYIAEDPTLPLVEVALAVRVGEYLDPPGKVGLAALTGALLRRGGTARWSADELDEAVDFLGAEMDTVTGPSRGGASLNCGSWVLEEALELFFEMLKTPRFEERRLAAAKSSLLESMARRNDDPLDVLQREWGWLLFGPDHFTVRQLTEASLRAITREDLVAFHRAYWRPENMILAVSGDVRAEDLLKRLEKHFADWVGGGPEVPWPPPSSTHTPKPGLYYLDKDVPQAKVMLGHLGVRRRSWEDNEAFAVLLLGEILGGRGAVSRLRSRLRAEEGLVYRADAHLGLGQFGPGEFRVFLETENRNVLRAIESVEQEIRRLRVAPVPEVELSLAKRSLIDAFPLLFDSAEKIAGRFAEDEYLGRPHRYWQLYRSRISAVTAAEIQRAAQRHLHPDRLVLVVVGRWGDVIRQATDEEGLAKALGVPVTPLPRRDPLTLEAGRTGVASGPP